MENIDIQLTIKKLFAAAGLQRVLSIDDQNPVGVPVEEALGITENLSAEAVADIFRDFPAITAITDADIRNRAIREQWKDLSDQQRETLLKNLRTSAGMKEGPLQEVASLEKVDEQTFVDLSQMFSNYSLELLSLRSWNAKKESLLGSNPARTLVLVDEDFSNEEGGTRRTGIELIRQIIASDDGKKLLCVLLSHNPHYEVDNVYQQWKALSEAESLPRSRFVLIPKRMLRTDRAGFARLVKLALLNSQAEELKQTAKRVIQNAERAALDRLDEFDIEDFDQVVFRSSRREGVWEPDTIFRVFNLFHNDETRKLARSGGDIFALADSMRNVSLVSTSPAPAETPTVIALQRLDAYENPEFLNRNYSPIDIGDIFQKTGTSSKRLILLAQSCDLMVRTDGKRHHTVVEAILAEIVTGSHQDDPAYAELPFLDEGSNSVSFVSFRKAATVRLSVLDLCAFNENGEAFLDLKATCPPRVIPAWQEHYRDVASEFDKVVRRIEQLANRGLSEKESTPLLTRCSNQGLFQCVIDVGRKNVRYNLRRIGRLRQPRAASLLARYSQYTARFAFEHEFVEHAPVSTPELSPPTGTMATDVDATDAHRS